MHDFHKIGYGGGIQAHLKVTPRLYATANAGYLHFNQEPAPLLYLPNAANVGGGLSDPSPVVKAIPVRIGVAWQPVPHFYVSGTAGVVSFLHNDYHSLIHSPTPPPNTVPDYNGGATASFSPGVGVRFGILDIAARYEVWTMRTTPSFFGLKAAVLF